jgi:MFS family permease
MPDTTTSPASPAPPALRLPVREATRLGELTAQQWKAGIAAWLGWLFDGLDMHLYVLVALPFVAELLSVNQQHADVGCYSSWIQAAFLVGWALGGGFFGIIGDRIGRTRTLMLTIVTYAVFTGLSYFAQAWWHLMLLRFVAALGIGGEWAVGAALLSETWPRRWRLWIAAILQTGVNIGVLLASLAVFVLADLPPESDNLRYTKMALNNGSGAIPALGFGTLIPDPVATSSTDPPPWSWASRALAKPCSACSCCWKEH